MKQYIVDAFADKVFSGNPAAICILDHWPSDELMMDIARENNLSETAFAVKEGEKYHLRWFTLAGEIDLCGHATMACAFVVLNYYEKGSTSVTFQTLSGDLTVNRNGGLFEIDFPAYDLAPTPVTDAMAEAIGRRPKAAYMGRDLLCVFENEADIKAVQPNLDKVKELDGLLLHITAQGTQTDCVSRTFAPKCNFPEDPVCGSGHCHIAPYWIKELKKGTITAYQASQRGGTLHCTLHGNRVTLAGSAVLYSVADLMV